MAIALMLIGFLVSGVFLAMGGAPMLLEAAFEAAFAGVMVRRLSGDFELGGWKMRLLKNTWKQALACIVVLAAVAAWLQHLAPQTNTVSGAVHAIIQKSKQ